MNSLPAQENAVDHFIGALWGAREMKRGKIDADSVKTWGRMLAEAVQGNVRESEGYSPEEDRKVRWAREVLASAVRGEVPCKASVELEATVEWLVMGRRPCGKDLAAGVSAE